MKLVIAEKPSVAMEIGKVLGVTKKENSYLKGSNYIISWCYGHLVGLAQPSVYDEKYQKWKIEDLPIIPTNYFLTINEETKEHFYYLKRLMNSDEIDEIICATDSGREGELIFRLVYEKTNCKKPVKRLWVSSLTEEAIKNGFKNLKNSNEYDNLYYAGKYRAIADWLVGLNATRYFSVVYGNKITVGRVQTPTLNMLVEREEKIKKFKKSNYYEIYIEQEDLGLIATTEKISSLEEATKIFEIVKSSKLICKDYLIKQKTKSPRKLYDLTTLQREANSILGYTASETLSILQGLYEKKIVTYPRTDSNYISDDMAEETEYIVKMLYNKFEFLNDIEFVCNINQVVNNDKVTDHHAILPTTLIKDLDIFNLEEKEKNILMLIVKSVLEATNNKCIYDDVKGVLNTNNGISLEFSYEKIVQKGYLKIEEKFTNKYKENTECPILTKGEEIKNFNTILETKETTPPKRFTEDTLLSAMENAGSSEYKELTADDVDKKGLGTPATRASIIEKLISIGYVERKGKSLIPTEKGINTINIVDEKLKSPLMTAEWEVKLQNIEKGNYNRTIFLDEIIEFTKNIVGNKNINTNIKEQMTNLNEKTKKEKEVIGICPCCNNNIYEADKNFYCSNKECSFTLFKEDKFFKDKKVKLTKTKAKQLLKDKVVEFDKLYSEKTNKFYNAKVSFEVSGKYINYKLIF